ncbi:MAG: CDP-glucose 4,6-dehydratase [Bacteroidetes bacterium]|nr:CDP-glucose 4,6-dehydratase [Bacteroidota bacterium]
MAIDFQALKQFYRDKKVLVTGHTGFKGSWLSTWLDMMGAKVYGYALDPASGKDNFNLCGLESIIHDTRADIRNLPELEANIKDVQPDIVFHLAAQALVIDSYLDPVGTYQTNIMGTVNLLEACRRNEHKRSIVVITSDKCYENKEWLFPYRENDPMGGHDPYSSSKGAAELICAAYRNSFLNSGKGSGQNLATARAGNVIGGGDWAANRLIPDCVRSIEAEKSLFLRFPGATRPWQHVLEPLGGYLLLGMMNYESKLYAEGWNFGPGLSGTYTVKQVVEKFFEFFGKGSWEQEGNVEFHEARLLSLDISKSYNRLGWKPILNFDNTLQLTADWYSQYSNVTSVLELCRQQINWFTSHAG